MVTSTQTVKTSTASETSACIISWTTTPVQTIMSRVQSPSPTSCGRPADVDRDYLLFVMTAAVSVSGILLIIIVGTVIIYFIVRLVHIHV